MSEEQSGDEELLDAALSFEDGEDDQDSPYRRASASERDLLKALSCAARVAKLHALENRITQEALSDFSARLRAFLSGAKNTELALVQGLGRISLNGATIKPKRHGRNWVTDVMELFETLGIGALILGGTWTQESCTELLRALRESGLGAPEVRLGRVEAAVARLIRAPATLRILNPEQANQLAGQDDEGDLQDSEEAIFLYSRLLALIEASVASLRRGQPPDAQVRHVRSTLMRMVESTRSELFEVRLLALTALPHRSEEPLTCHLVNTAILSMCCARLLDLPRGHLIDLGFSAVFADMGRAVLGQRAFLTHEGAELDQSEAPAILSVAGALRSRGFGSAGLLRLAVAEESRRALTEDATAGLRSPHPYSQIVALCAEFDRRTAGTPWSPPQNPARVLRDFRADPTFPQTCVQLLADVLGVRPRGSLVRCQNGERGVVIDGGARHDNKCVVRVLTEAGRLLRKPRLVEVEPEEPLMDLPSAAVKVDWTTALLH